MRKLVYFTIAFALTTLYAGYSYNSGVLIVICGVFAVFSLVFVLFRKRTKLLDALFLISIGIACGAISFYLHQNLEIDRCEVLDGQTASIELEVSSYPKSGDGYSRIEGIIRNGDLPNSRIILTDSKSGSVLQTLLPGDRVLFDAKLKSSDKRYGDSYDYYYSSGIYLLATLKSDIQVLGHSDSIRYLPVKANHALSDAVNKLFGGDTAAFLKSLMLNNRTDFNARDELYTAFSRSGIMHIIAVSGMHITFLAGFIKLAFGNGKKSSWLCLIIIWFFVFMTGFSPSASRAGIMVSLVLLGNISERESDSPTALFAALLVLLLINPYAVKSISLQLSFASTAGILAFSAPIFSALTRRRKSGFFPAVYRYIISIIACSAGVLILSLPLMMYHFGTVPVLSILANILCMWAVSVSFIGGYISALVYFISPAAAKIFSVPVSAAVRYIINVASRISAVPFSTLYINNADNTALYLMLGIYAVCIILGLTKLKTVYKILIPVVLFSAGIYLTVTVTKAQYEAVPSISAIDVGQGQSISVFSGKDTVLIDCGSSFSADNAGDTAGKYLLSCGREKINLLLITHLHEDHANGITHLFNYIKIDEIVLSEDFKDDTVILPKILRKAAENGTKVTYISNNATSHVGNISIDIFNNRDENENDNENCLCGIVTVGDYDMLFTADASIEAENGLLKYNDIPSVELLVIGHHGSKYSCGEELLEKCRGAAGIISTGYNTYGHPSEETIKRAEKYLSAIYRTDEAGTVNFVLGNKEEAAWQKSRLTDAILRLKQTA